MYNQLFLNIFINDSHLGKTLRKPDFIFLQINGCNDFDNVCVNNISYGSSMLIVKSGFNTFKNGFHLNLRVRVFKDKTQENVLCSDCYEHLD